MIKLTTLTGSKEVLINPDQISLIKQTANHFGESYVEIYVGDQNIEVQETIVEIENMLYASGVMPIDLPPRALD